MNLQETVPSTQSQRAAPGRTQPPRELLVHALNAVGAISCRMHSDDFTFSNVDDAIHARTGITAQRWCSTDFWDRHLHPDDRAALEDAKRVARLGWHDLNLSFRIVNGVSSTAIQLVGHKRSERPGSRPMLDGYLLPVAREDANPTPPGIAVRALEQARRDLIRTSQLAVAGELVGAITHDLRQPLTALQVNIEVATQSLHANPAQLAIALAALEDAGDDGRKLRDSVQVLHNLVAHREPIRTSVALGAIVTEVVRLVQSEADARQVRLRVVTARALPLLSADASMLREAVLSIVLDAVENAVPVDGLTRVQVDTKALDDSSVELAVTHLRRPDSNEDDAWALRVARLVAESHGATVSIESSSASETVVRTTWPASTTPAPHDAPTM
jgi:hypothetical protein